MNFVNPDKDPNRWLEAVMLDLLEQNTDDSKAMLADGIRSLSRWIEPGLVDQLFGHWIEKYNQLLAEHEKNQNNSHRQYLQADQPVLQE